MTGDDVGPDRPDNLEGDVAFTLGSGCGAVRLRLRRREQRPDRGRAGEARRRRTSASRVPLDGSASYDDVQPVEDLTYQLGRRRQRHVRQVRHERRADVQRAGRLHRRPEGDGRPGPLRHRHRHRHRAWPPTSRSRPLGDDGERQGREGEKATLKATVLNAGTGAAPASKTEFLLDGTNGARARRHPGARRRPVGRGLGASGTRTRSRATTS